MNGLDKNSSLLKKADMNGIVTMDNIFNIFKKDNILKNYRNLTID
jgi:hypothetical protein